MAVRKAFSGGFLSLLDIPAALFCPRRNPDRLLPIVAISYPWLAPDHPDRHGQLLQLMCSRLGSLYGGKGLLGACREYGFSDMGVFIDWASLFQKDAALWREWMADDAIFQLSDGELGTEFAAEGARMAEERAAYVNSRTPEQKAAFNHALTHTMDLWYGHTSTTVVLVTELPAGFTGRDYASRGWCTFERCSAELGKGYGLMKARWRLVIDISDENASRRALPTTSASMERILPKKHFTNNADLEAVLHSYAKVEQALLGNIQSLNYNGLWLESRVGSKNTVPRLTIQDSDSATPKRPELIASRVPEKLAAVLNRCPYLRKLHMAGMNLNATLLGETMSRVGAGALPALIFLDMSKNNFGPEGVGALCDAFRKGVAPALERLDLSVNRLEDAGAKIFARALCKGHVPPRLKSASLYYNAIGDEGMKALAAAVLERELACELHIACNRGGIASQAALFKALEARHGLAFGHALNMFMSPPFWPHAVTRALGRGYRLAVEDGGSIMV